MTINQAFFQVVSMATTAGLRLTALPAGRSFCRYCFYVRLYRRLCRVNGRWPESDPHPALFKQGNRELKRLVHPNAVYRLSWGIAHCRNVSSKPFGDFFRLCIGVYCQYAGDYRHGRGDFSAFASVVATLNNLGPGLGWLLITLPV